MIAKRWRGIGRAAGRVVDADDRRVLAQAAALVLSTGALLVAAAGMLGLAWRVFGLAAG